MFKPRLTTVTLLSLLAAAIAASVALGLALRRAYGEALLKQIWPGGAPPLSQGYTNVGEAAPTILLLGDSRVAEWPEFKLPGAQVVNGGVGGQTTAQLLLHCGPTLDRIHPQVVVLQAGINDLKAIGLYPELRDRITSTCRSNLLAVVEECERRRIRVLVMAVWPAGRVAGMRRLVWNKHIAEAVGETNHGLEQALANRPFVRWTDLFSRLDPKAVAGGGVSLYRDTLHLRPESYGYFTPLLIADVEPWLPEKR